MDAMVPTRSLAAVALAAALLAPGAMPAAAEVAAGCEVTDATLTWGFKESFRAYIDGAIANGEWTTADGATYATPDFGWSGGTGRYDPETGTGFIGFTGSVRFTGHGGILDTTIADPGIRFDGASAVLLLDVSGVTMEGDPTDVTGVEFVSLPVLHVAGDDAVRTVDAATTLTEDGATAFPNYAPGEAFDPLTLSMNVGKQCPTAPREVDTPGERPSGWPVVAALVAVLVIAAALAAVFVLTRRRRA